MISLLEEKLREEVKKVEDLIRRCVGEVNNNPLYNERRRTSVKKASLYGNVDIDMKISVVKPYTFLGLVLGNITATIEYEVQVIGTEKKLGDFVIVHKPLFLSASNTDKIIADLVEKRLLESGYTATAYSLARKLAP